MIVALLIYEIETSPRLPIENCIEIVKKQYGKTISRRKAYFGHKRGFERIYSTWENSFSTQPRYMAALQHFNPSIMQKVFLNVFLGI